LLAVGKLLTEALKAADLLAASGISTTVWDVRSCAPLDPEMIADAARHQVVITAEDGIRDGGIGMAIADLVSSANQQACVRVLGTPARFIPQGVAEGLLAQIGLDAEGLANAARGPL
jgi:1-deoxy-D-xylulose-5-phosphate synthase